MDAKKRPTRDWIILIKTRPDTWYGEMPMTMIFDATGNRVHVHKKALTKEELAADVEALIP